MIVAIYNTSPIYYKMLEKDVLYQLYSHPVKPSEIGSSLIFKIWLLGTLIIVSISSASFVQKQ